MSQERQSIDLAEGRRLLDAYKGAQGRIVYDQRPYAEAWQDWSDTNAEVVLTLLEQARVAAEAISDHEIIAREDWDKKWADRWGVPGFPVLTSPYEIARKLLSALTATDVEVKHD